MAKNILQGKKATLTIFLQDSPVKPHDLTGVTEIATCFTNQDGTELMVSLTGTEIAIIGNPILGQITISLTAAQTALLEAVDLASLELAITTTGDPIGVLIPGAYSVLTSSC